jgi:hypothetical protein
VALDDRAHRRQHLAHPVAVARGDARARHARERLQPQRGHHLDPRDLRALLAVAAQRLVREELLVQARDRRECHALLAERQLREVAIERRELGRRAVGRHELDAIGDGRGPVVVDRVHRRRIDAARELLGRRDVAEQRVHARDLQRDQVAPPLLRGRVLLLGRDHVHRAAEELARAIRFVAAHECGREVRVDAAAPPVGHARAERRREVRLSELEARRDDLVLPARAALRVWFGEGRRGVERELQQ